MSNNKQKRRQERRDRNRTRQEEHIAKEIARGRVMWENNNGQELSLSWINSQLPSLVEGLWKGVREGEEFLMTWIQTHRILIRDIILRWPSQQPYTPEYYLLKSVLEVYWDFPKVVVDHITNRLNEYKYAKEKDNSTSY